MRTFLSPAAQYFLMTTAFVVGACASHDDDDVDSAAGMVMTSAAHPGRQTIHFAVDTPGAPDEVCIQPNHIAGGS
jgi:hypothetical protein